MSYYLLITIYYSLFKELVPFYIRIFGTKFRYYKPKDRQIILDYQCKNLRSKYPLHENSEESRRNSEESIKPKRTHFISSLNTTKSTIRKKIKKKKKAYSNLP